MKLRWAPTAAASAQRYLRDQAGIRAVSSAVAALVDDPYQVEAFHRGRYHRLRVGPYRVIYVIDDDLITVERVDRITGR